MLKILALQIRISTNNGLYGTSLAFSDGLNIVRGHNSTGKSTVFQAILYGLGMEELLGGKNDKVMQSVLKDEILDWDGNKIGNVIESSITLEISNGVDSITTRRYVRSSNFDSKLIQIIEGPLLNNISGSYKQIDTYVHAKDAAQDSRYGFHAYLENFLKIRLPILQYGDGSKRKLYFQLLFPSFVVEQKLGWSDFFATMPYYNLKEPEKKIVEYLLDFDSQLIDERKENIKFEKQQIIDEWSKLYAVITEMSRRGSLEVSGLIDKPQVDLDANLIKLSKIEDTTTINLSDHIRNIAKTQADIESSLVPKISEVAYQKERELSLLNQRHGEIMANYDLTTNQLSQAESNLNIIQARLKQIEVELYQNKQHKRLRELGSTLSISVSVDTCPTCEQEIQDSLLPTEDSRAIMSIDENIGYLEAQRKMATNYVNAHKEDIKHLKNQAIYLEQETANLRTTIRAIKRDLVSDDRLPSSELIEERIKIRNQIKFFTQVLIDFELSTQKAKDLSTKWTNLLAQESAINSEGFSALDWQKYNTLNSNFLSLLRRFEYKSKSISDLKISTNKLIPVADSNYSLKFDSSASDLNRAIYAYTIALLLTSASFHGRHPGFIMFDEPGSQETAISALHSLLMILSTLSNTQSIVFASFKQDDSDFAATTKGINFTLVAEMKSKFIEKVN